MEFTSQQLTDLEGLLWRAAEDFDFQKEFIADPVGVIARDAGVQLPADTGMRILFSSDADLSLVLPIPQENHGGAQPSVIYPEYDVADEDLDKFKYLAQHIPAVVTRCLEDGEFRKRLTSDSSAAIQECCGVELRHNLQFIDPLEADYTLIMPTRDAAAVSRPVICVPPGPDADEFGLPGVSVHTFGQPLAATELSDEALDAVVGGTGSKSSPVVDAFSNFRKTLGF